jgi:hypothetical protein
MNIIRPTIAAVAIALILAPSAHAEYSRHLNCLKQGGPMGAGSLDVSDSDQAVRLGNQILHDLRTGAQTTQTIYSALESQAGFSYWQAVTAVSCALSSNVGGSIGS